FLANWGSPGSAGLDIAPAGTGPWNPNRRNAPLRRRAGGLSLLRRGPAVRAPGADDQARRARFSRHPDDGFRYRPRLRQRSPHGAGDCRGNLRRGGTAPSRVPELGPPDPPRASDVAPAFGNAEDWRCSSAGSTAAAHLADRLRGGGEGRAGLHPCWRLPADRRFAAIRRQQLGPRFRLVPSASPSQPLAVPLLPTKRQPGADLQLAEDAGSA